MGGLEHEWFKEYKIPQTLEGEVAMYNYFKQIRDYIFIHRSILILIDRAGENFRTIKKLINCQMCLEKQAKGKFY